MLAVLAGCQPLPRPFAPGEGARPNPLLEIKDGFGLAVLDMSGAPGPTATAFTPALIKALLARNVPAAFSAGNSRSAFVYGEASTKRLDGKRLEVAIDWHLIDPKAGEIGRHRMTAQPLRKDWESAGPAMIKAMAEASAGGITTLLRGEPDRGDTLEARQRRVFVGAVTGDEAVDGAVLRDAMIDAMHAARIGVSRRRAEDDLVLSARISLGPARAGRRRMKIDWRLADETGRRIGKLAQANDVEVAALKSEWPGLVRLIAFAATGELRALIAAARRPQPEKALRANR